MIRPGQRIGHFDLERLLGRGGMGEVWLARQDVLRRHVALKLIAGHLVERPGAIERFTREAACCARLNHPHIVTLHEFGELTDADGDRHWVLVMEYIAGSVSGRSLLRGPVPWRIAAGVCAHIAQALAAAHAAGIVHRDVKPDNILISPDGRAKLADFGLARAADDAPLTQPGSTQGSPAYLPPEGWRGEPCTAAADIYSLGVTLFHLLNGKPPYQADAQWGLMQAHCTDPIPELQVPGVPATVISLVRASMAKDPQQRPASAVVFAETLERAIDGGFHPSELNQWLQGSAETIVQPSGRRSGSSVAAKDAMPPATTVCPPTVPSPVLPVSASVSTSVSASTASPVVDSIKDHKPLAVSSRWWVAVVAVVVAASVAFFLMHEVNSPSPLTAPAQVATATDLVAQQRLDAGLTRALAAMRDRKPEEARKILESISEEARMCGRQAEVERLITQLPQP